MAIKSDAQRKAVAKYNAAKYDRILLRVDKGEKERIQAHAAAHGKSQNEFIVQAINEKIARDLSEDRE